MAWIIVFFFCTTIFADQEPPRISIITSLYKGGKFINQFMEEMVKQTVFAQCELIIISANSPDNESSIIREYQSKYSNIIYIILDHDPGLYAVWNMAIKKARGKYIVNANVDDRVCYTCYEKYMQFLDEHPEIDLVYSDYYDVIVPNIKASDVNSPYCKYHTIPEFNPQILNISNVPNDHPMWRKSCHDMCGYFDEALVIAGDFDMWVRMIRHGCKFKKIHGIYGMHYANPHGLSTSSKNQTLLKSEIKKVYLKNKDILTSFCIPLEALG